MKNLQESNSINNTWSSRKSNYYFIISFVWCQHQKYRWTLIYCCYRL